MTNNSTKGGGGREGRFSLSGPMRRLLSYFGRHRRWPILGVAAVLCTNLIKISAPWVLRHAIDSLVPGVTQTRLLYMGGALVLVALVQGGFYFLQRRVFARVARHIEFDLRNDYYAHLQKLPFAELSRKHRTGDLMARGTDDLAAVRVFCETAVMSAMDMLCAVLLVVPVMIAISGWLTLVSLLVLPLVALATRYFSNRIHDRSVEVQEQFGLLSSRAQESLAGVRVVRAYGRGGAEIEEFAEASRELLRRNARLIKVSAFLNPILQFLIGLAFIAVFAFGGYLIVNGGLTVGQYVQMKVYLGFLIVPVVTFGWVVSLFQRGRASMARIHQLMELAPLSAREPEAGGVARVAGEIEFRDLTFRYADDAAPALEGVNLRIPQGTTVAFVGSVGSGKSTLLSLVPRLLEAAPGQLLIDGRRADEIPPRALRSAIGYVPQETFLFSETLAENIGMGREGATRDEIERAAEEAGLDEDIRDFPEGFETLVGERGMMLSGGQKQRAAIARALLRRPAILILDDALSAVDTYTERRILAHLRRAMRGRTSLIATHRVSNLKDADLIVVLEGGRVAETGSHAELVARGGIYATMFEKQMLEEEMAAA
jgi:ATP-binding cassette, subfamily B, multidrug efflux pump